MTGAVPRRWEGRIGRALCLSIAAAVASACPTAPGDGTDGGSSPDAGEVDAGLDAGEVDAGVDAGLDSGSGAGDSGVDAGLDAGVDSGAILCVPPVNGCDAGDYLDATDAGPVVDVFFGDAGFPFAYLPRCVRIASGQSLRFQGNFGFHTLRQNCGPVTAIPFTVSGTSHTFPFSQPGPYGYLCTEHAATNGMEGAVDVVP